jgi:hypothetical protein
MLHYLEWSTWLYIALLSIVLSFVCTLRRFKETTHSVTVLRIGLVLAFLATIGTGYWNAERALKEEFNRTALFAQGDSRLALDKLKLWAMDPSYPLANAAEKAWLAVVDSHEEYPEIPPAVLLPWYPLPWGNDFDPAPFSVSQLWSHFANELPRFRVGVLCFIWRKDDVPMKDRLAVFTEVIQKDPSLEVVSYAGKCFRHGSNDGLKNLDVEGHIKWWKEHKNDLK